ncbi:RNA polymerase subunit sigma-24 [Paenibacillus sp. y28]|uniref:RNA polymerase subunit sigma-24 n=1 Tax=Paenibacillus sp. y28 TaxID=3129110 RepID=UPI003017ABEC
MGAQKSQEHSVIEHLKEYKRILGRIRILERQPIGNGMYLSAVYGDDKLQALHRQLRDMPSYMYLSKREQQLETTAHAYLERYPLGTRSQLHEVTGLKGLDDEDEKTLRELQQKIQRVLEARTGTAEGFEAVIERMSELQDLKVQAAYYEQVFEVLGEYNQQYAQALRLQYVDGLSSQEIIRTMGLSQTVYYSLRKRALQEFAELTQNQK